ncbi:ABC transporter ATP-binding protein [Paenalkalicoccus suaedae]|uniref:ABC transporter ATP-binding protein n=1 Tax=Paenalkalicoccus suaedae TaxID=2592382 RepID=A0A859FCH1_9BACI|nr:ABC transporter ATP-binding protein [Paenalkalicoccus suaedae]QKS69965.1 ABC transporter ATP-binding protein [Paenalkalicoccus suaedae]
MYKHFFSYYKPYKKLFAIDFGGAILVGILSLIYPLILAWYLDTLLPSQDWNIIVTAGVGLLLLYAAIGSLQYVVNYWGHMLGINIETDLRYELFSHIQKQQYQFFDDNKTGSLMSRITNDLMEIGELAHHGPEDIFIAIMTFIGAFVIMLTINVQLALVSIVTFPIIVAIIIFSNINMNKSWNRMFESLSRINSRIEDSISGSRVVKSYTNEKHESKHFKKNNVSFRASKLKAYKTMSVNFASTYLVTRLTGLAVLLYGAWLTIQGQLSIGELVAFVLYMTILFEPIDKISNLLELYPRGMAGFKRFMEMKSIKPTIVDAPDAKALPIKDGSIEFKGVTFAYDSHQTVLNDLSFKVEPGKTVALVGTSGAGKSTLCALIPRFYEQQAGEILVDGVNTKDMTLESLRSQIGVVQQDTFLFAGTIFENILYGRLDATEEEVYEAARSAHLMDFIEALPDGFNTEIGERGLKLSGGQKQRLSIARVFLKNPAILILDEATSALDTETEQAVQHSLRELQAGRTTMVIAHRLNTIRDADVIFVMTKDGIVDEGAYDELIAKGGLFARLAGQRTVSEDPVLLGN